MPNAPDSTTTTNEEQDELDLLGQDDLQNEGDNQDDEGQGGDAEAGDDAGGEGDEGEVVVSIGDDDGVDPLTVDSPDDSSVIKQLRTRVRESAPALRAKERELRQLREENERLKGVAQQPVAIEVGAEPDPDNYEMWDDEGKAKFKQDYAAWNKRRLDAEEQERAVKRAQEKAQAEWHNRLNAVDSALASLKVSDRSAANQAFEDLFPTTTKKGAVCYAILMNGPEDPKDAALLRYALGKTPSVAKKLAEIEDPVRFAFAAAKLLYKEINVKPRKAAPAPDTVVRSTVSGAAAVDSELKRLQEEADKTGDRSKVAAHLRKKNQAKQAA